MESVVTLVQAAFTSHTYTCHRFTSQHLLVQLIRLLAAPNNLSRFAVSIRTCSIHIPPFLPQLYDLQVVKDESADLSIAVLGGTRHVFPVTCGGTVRFYFLPTISPTREEHCASVV